MKTDIKKLILKDKKHCYLTLNSKVENDVLNEAASALKNDVKIILFYNDKLNDKDKISLAKKLHQLCSIYDGLLIIAFRSDIAQIIGCEGVFLDENSISIEQAKKIICDKKFIATNYNDEKSDFIIEVNINDSYCENKVLRIQVC